VVYLVVFFKAVVLLIMQEKLFFEVNKKTQLTNETDPFELALDTAPAILFNAVCDWLELTHLFRHPGAKGLDCNVGIVKGYPIEGGFAIAFFFGIFT
jgi:hypothetical protein